LYNIRNTVLKGKIPIETTAYIATKNVDESENKFKDSSIVQILPFNVNAF
jgi:hypothetical protein